MCQAGSLSWQQQIAEMPVPAALVLWFFELPGPQDMRLV